MSTEATGDARPDAADPPGQAAAGRSTAAGELPEAARGTGEATGTNEDAEAARGRAAAETAQAAETAADDAAGDDAAQDDTAHDDTGAARDSVGGDGPADDEDDWHGEPGEEGAGAVAEHDAGDADAPAEPIELAEPVDLDEPGTAVRPARRRSRVLVALGFVVLAVAIVGGAIAIVGSVTHGFKKPVKVTYKTSPVFSLKTGDCFDPAGQSYTLVSCDSPHQAEVFATFALPDGNWPGSTAVAADAGSGCGSRLTGYLNPQLAISLASTYVYPDANAWQAGTRTVVCEVRAASGELTGSVRGASATAG